MGFDFGCDLVNLGSCLWKETEPDRKYVYELEGNFRSLKTAMERLIEKKNARNRDVSRANERGMRPTDTLTGWLRRVEAKENEVRGILETEEGPRQLPNKCLGGCCYKNYLAAHTLGKSVADILPFVTTLCEEGDKLREDEMFTVASVDDLPVEETVGMDHKFDEVWNCLCREHDPAIIRICGMGGVGKTVLLTKINNEFLKQTFGFDLVIFIESSRSSDIPSVQLAIGEKLRLAWPENASEPTRAKSIKASLQKKRFVLLIDDLRNFLDLTEVGVPTQYNHNKSKVVFTTRNEAVCAGMGDDHITIPLDCLEWKHALSLFQKSVGEMTLNSHPEIPALAQTVAELCDKLPLALVTVGRAMSSKRTPEEWKCAIAMLKKFAPQFGGMHEKVYSKFLVSYDCLEDTCQPCFLYCSLFPNDYLVDKEQLIYYWMGENFLTEFQKLNENRDHGHTIINTLMTASLLKRDKDEKARMHDTIRGSALWIASECGKKKNKFWVQSGVTLPELPTDSNWPEVERMSVVKSRIKKLTKIDCPSLSTLILNNSILEEISSGFFQPMHMLKVLDLSCCNIDQLPIDITTLTKLQYLNLSHTYISELPLDFKNLEKLKFLDLSFIEELQMIPAGVISNLLKLQLLNMFSSGSGNKIVKGGVLYGGGEALLEELKHLDNLEDLRITLTNGDALQKLRSSTKLEFTHSLFITKCEALTSLQLPHVENMVNLKVLHVLNCPDLDELKISWDGEDEDKPSGDPLFNSEIRSQGWNLRDVEIKQCWKLKNLTWLKYAPTLQSLRVVNCMQMEEVISDSHSGAGAGMGQIQLFSGLKSIYLSGLPQLKIIYNNALTFPALEEIIVFSCPKMKKLPLDANSAKETLRLIRGQKNWWDNLQWEDDNVKPNFSPFFQLSKG